MLQDELSTERPIWMMSCYAPVVQGEVQLFGGFPLEQSQEEIRTLHYQALATGNIQQSVGTCSLHC